MQAHEALLRSDPVLVVNGDTFVDADLAPLLAARAEAAMLCVRVPDAGRYGRIEIRRRLRRALRRKGPRVSRGEAAINAGVYLLSARLLDGHPARIGAVSLERDVFEKLPPGSIAACISTPKRASWISARPKAGAVPAPW
jgi:NDP-sugar pyrophosphorylase family protein